MDEEGGPYKFTKVTYFLDRDVLDMRYSRSSTLTLNQAIPSNFRLTGNWSPKNGGSIKGRVISGTRGWIGNFTVLRQPLLSDVETNPKYVGTWIGSPIDVLLSEGVYATTNPPDFEFDFTPGRIGSMIFMNVPFSFNNFAFDYLRGRAIFTDNGTNGVQTPTSAIVFDFDPDTHEFRGSQYGMYKGKVGDFEAKQVR